MRGPDIGVVGEEGLIERLRRRCGPIAPPPPEGIGDDAARLRPRAGHTLFWSTDLLVEGVHFHLVQTPPRCLGRKSLAVTFSDLGAMGATPRAFLLGLALPPTLPLAWFDEFVEGVAQAGRRCGAFCAGGDTTASPDRVVISGAAVGEAPRRHPLARDGARPGQGLWVSGPLGASSLGLRLLREGWRLEGRKASREGAGAGEPGPAGRALRAHLDPAPPLGLGPWLARRGVSRAAIDLSDGLSTDLNRLCAASGVGARIDARAIPVDRAVAFWARRLGVDPLRLALDGGEEYALLFAVPRGREAMLRGLPAGTGARPVRIGVVVKASQGVRLVEPGGRTSPLRPGGFEHFPPVSPPHPPTGTE